MFFSTHCLSGHSTNTTNNNNKPLFSVYQHWSLFIQINDQENVSWSYATARCLCDIIYELFCMQRKLLSILFWFTLNADHNQFILFVNIVEHILIFAELSSSNEEQNNFPIKTAICKKTCSPFSNHAFVFVRFAFPSLSKSDRQYYHRLIV